ncbi:DUF3466 family protein [Vibrio sp. FNV 38]|nr:DUF3466 family protein [Vibrio sp. FNV 38]
MNYPNPLSVFVMMMCASFPSYSALYRVVEVDSTLDDDTLDIYSTAISSDSTIESCFSTSCVSDDFVVAGHGQNGAPGVPFNEEVAFGIDNYFYYLDYDALETYCYSELGYATCDSWASLRWYGDYDTSKGGLEQEREAYYYATYSPVYHSFFEQFGDVSFTVERQDKYSSDSEPVDGTQEVIVENITQDNTLVGNATSGYFEYYGNYIQQYRRRGFYFDGAEYLELPPKAEVTLSYADEEGETNIIEDMGTTLAFDSFVYPQDSGIRYVLGSAAVATFDYTDEDKDYDSRDVSDCVDSDTPANNPQCQNFGFATKAFAWRVDDQSADGFSVSDWDSDYDNYDESAAQASVRGVSLIVRSDSDYDGLPVLVGYNTELNDDDYMLMQASVYRPIDVDNFSVAENAWESVFISGAKLEDDDTYYYTNSIATDVNQNLIIIGEAKRDGDIPENSAAANRMFIADASVEQPTATYFSSLGQDIFFTGAGGELGGINNYNEIVGEVDAEDLAEIDGDARRRRGFIYPYNSVGTDSERSNVLSDRAWWLDDLTQGGFYSDDNNHYRIISAADINDSGVISATAIKCESGYDDSTHFASCGEGDETEYVVAVKLIPILGATSDDIESRDTDTTTIDRQGASSSLLVLWLIGMLSCFRRLQSLRSRAQIR